MPLASTVKGSMGKNVFGMSDLFCSSTYHGTIMLYAHMPSKQSILKNYAH